MFEYFDDNARRIIRRTKQESVSLNHDYMGTEHLLLGLFSSQPFLTRLAGSSYHALQTSVCEQIGGGSRPTYSYVQFTPEVNSILRRSVDVMMQRHHFPLTPLHIAIAALEVETDNARALLQQSMVDVDLFTRRLDYQLHSVPTTWSVFHRNLPRIVPLYQQNFTASEVLHLHQGWRSLAAV